MNVPEQEIESESEDDWSETFEMADQDQMKLLREINKHWTDHKIVAPRWMIYELESADRWSDWRYKMRAHFMCYRLDELVDTNFDPMAKETSEFKNLNRYAVMNIGMNLSASFRNLVIGSGTGDEIDSYTVWKRLVSQFEGHGTVQAIRCFGRITKLMTDRDGSAAQTIATIREVKAKFDEHKDDGEALWKAILINSLPSESETLQTILSTQPESKKLEDMFQLALQSEQITAIDDCVSSRAMVNKVTSKKESKGSRQPRCFECGQVGHFKRNCEIYKKRIRLSAGNQQQQSNPKSLASNNGGKQVRANRLIVRENSDEEVLDLNAKSFAKIINAHLLYKSKGDGKPEEDDQNVEELDLNYSAMLGDRPGGLQREVLNLNPRAFRNLFDTEPETDQQDENHKQNAMVATLTDRAASCRRIKTIADSGCNRPMFSSTDGVSDLKTGGGPLYTASSESIDIDGIGDKTLTTSLDKKIELKDVIVCSQLNSNFLSISQFDKEGYYIEIWNGRMNFYRDGKELVMIAELDGDDLYEIKLKNSCNVLVKPNDDQVVEWHIRLSHVGLDSVRALKERLKLRIPGNYKLECVVCLKGKMTRSAFDRIHVRTDAPLKLIHTDLSGIIRIPNKQKYRYFLIFVDDYSRFAFLYLLKSKEQVFETFREFKNMIEEQMESKIKRLKSDGGSEYDNKKLHQLCASTGMVQNFSAPRCPPQNGGPERLNRTIEQMARCMLLEAVLCIEFWPYAVLYAVFIKNRIPHKAIGGQIPIELFYNTTVDFESIRKFGCRVIYLVDDREITKFDPTGEDGLFLGVPNGYRAFYVYSLTKKKVIIRRHVYFLQADENQLKDRVLGSSGGHTSDELFECGEPESDWLGEATNQPGFSFIATEFDQESPEDRTEIVEQPAGSSDIANQQSDSEPPRNDQMQQQAQNEDHQVNSGALNQPSAGEQDQSSIAQLLDNRPASGTEIKISKAQKKKILERFGDLQLTFVRPVNTKGRQPGAGVYRVNAVIVPRNFKQVGKVPEQELWNQAMRRELESMDELGVWKEVDRPPNKKVLPMIWVYRVKYLPTGQIDKYKARLCVLGNLQDSKKNQSFYSPVLNDVSLRLLLSFGVHHRMHIHHVDVCTAYLHADIEEEVYVDFPQGMIRKKGKCLGLRKSLYGLRSSPLSWYNTATSILIGLGFSRTKSDQCVFIRRDANGELALIGLYVDDLVLLCDGEKQMEQLKSDINEKFTISDKAPISQFLNLEISYDRQLGVLKISQTEYLRQTLEQFGMSDCSGKRTVCPSGAELFEKIGTPLDDAGEYMTLVGILIYVSTRSRPDLKFIVSRLCQFMSCATDYHLELAKHVLRYVKQTVDYAIYYTAEGSAEVQVDCDADYANDKMDSRSVTGVCVQAYGNLIEWTSCKQQAVAKSTCQAELQAISEGVDSLLFTRNFLNELTNIALVQFRLFCDNQSALQTLRTGGNFGNNKRYRVLIHGIMETLEQPWVEAIHKSTDRMEADFLTKSLTADQLSKLLGLVNVF